MFKTTPPPPPPPSPLFDLVIFQISSYILAWSNLDCNPPIYASCITWKTGTQHHAQISVEMWFSPTFCPGWPWTMTCLISASWVAGITGIRHCVWPKTFFFHFSSLCPSPSARISLVWDNLFGVNEYSMVPLLAILFYYILLSDMEALMVSRKSLTLGNSPYPWV
jgi:hypothetical protein